MFLAAESPPAGGAALDEVVLAFLIIVGVYIPIGWFLLRERTGHATAIGRAADWMASKDGMPRWAGLPIYLAVLSLISCGFGVYWDVPIHMQYGRDEGPLANPSHFPILFGILGFLAAGVLSAGLAKDPLPRRTVRFAKDWHVPMGSMILLGAGLIALVGFPADDVWHRLFGQDVTEWGPTHVMMIGGAVTCCLAVPLLLAEARQTGSQPFRTGLTHFIGTIAITCMRWVGKVLPPVSREADRIGGDERAWTLRFAQTAAISLCIIPFAFLMEFELGVPQFPAATLFIISGFLSAWIFTTARIHFGPGGALVAWTIYLTLRLLILLVTLPLPDIHHARWLLLLGPAVVIELVALAMRDRGPRFGAIAGGLGAGVGLVVDIWWIGVFMPAPLPVAGEHVWWLLLVGAVAGVGGGLVAPVWARLLERIIEPAPAVGDASGPVMPRRGVGTLGVVLLVALMAYFAPPTSAGEVEVVKECEGETCTTSYVPLSNDGLLLGEVDYEENCIGEEGCRTDVTVRISPTDGADGALWLSSIAYQGFHTDDPVYPTGQLTADLEPTGQPGEYRTERPLPLYGEWKAFLRLHKAPTTMLALPLYLPEDPAIDSNASGLVQVADGATVPWVYEPMMLQREREDDVPVWLWTVAYALVIIAWLGLLVYYGWCFNTAARGGTSRTGSSARQTSPSA